MIKGNLPSGCSTGGLKRFKLPLEAGLMKGVCAGVTKADEDRTHFFRVGPPGVHPTGRGLGECLLGGSPFVTDPDAEANTWAVSGLRAAAGQVLRTLLPHATWYSLGPQTSHVSGPVLKRTNKALFGSLS